MGSMTACLPACLATVSVVYMFLSSKAFSGFCSSLELPRSDDLWTRHGSAEIRSVKMLINDDRAVYTPDSDIFILN